jgi:DNA-binding IclR family transcriptional regulator
LKQGTPDYAVRAVVRAVRLLELLRTSDGGAGLNELVEGSGLAKASVFRLLRTLEGLGFVERVDGADTYRLGVRCLELGSAYLEQIDLRREAMPVLEELRDRFDETVHLGVLDDEFRVVYLEKLDSTQAVGIMMSRVGKTAPSFCTGLGKALLAARGAETVAALEERNALRRFTPNTIYRAADLRRELELTRRRGYALDLEEHEPGVRCVACAVDVPGGPLAALSIAGPAHRLPESLLGGELADAATAAARSIEARLGAGRREPAA